MRGNYTTISNNRATPPHFAVFRNLIANYSTRQWSPAGHKDARKLHDYIK